MKKLLALLLALSMMGAAFASCSAPASEAPAESDAPADASEEAPAEEAPAGDVSFRFSWWGSEVRHEATLAAMDAYMTATPGVTIEGEYSGYDGYQDKLMAQVAGGNAPDVFTSVTEWYPALYEADAMHDITGAFDMSGHSQAIIDACSYDGKVYGVSVSLNSHGFTYNETLVEELGLTVPTGDYTWDDVMAFATSAYDASGGEVYGMLDLRMQGEAFAVYGYTALGKEYPYMWSETEVTATAEDWVNYMEYIEGQPEGTMLPPEESFVVDAMTYAPVAHRDTLMDVCSLGTFAVFQSQTEDKLSVLPFPKGPNGEQGDAARPGLILNVYSGADDAIKPAATAFIDWFSNSADAAVILGLTRGVLPTTTQREALLATECLVTEDDMVYIDAINTIYAGDMKTFLPGPAGADQIYQQVIKNVGQEVAFGELSVEESGERFMEECNNVLDR